MTTRQISCLSPPRELSISITYLLQSLSALLKFPSNSLKNFGFTLDCHLTMNAHVSNIARTCYFKRCCLASIRRLQMSAPPDSISELLHSMQSCISDVKVCATANMLRLSHNKTELMLVTSKRTKHLHSLPTSITIGNAQLPFKKSVKNLGFTLDCHLTMNAHVSNIARTCYFELRRLVSFVDS